MIDELNIRKSVGIAICLERVGNRYTRQELADAINCTAKTIENIEKGKQKINLPMYLEICSFFNKGISYFLPDNWKQIRKGV